MPHQEKNTKGRNTQRIILLPITGTLFIKKVLSKEAEHDSIDFHLDIIKKIDKLLAEHEGETPSAASFHAPPIIPPQPPTPIEPRPPLNKALSHREIAWEPTLELPRTQIQTIPEEFKTELTINPEFRFITSQEFMDTISHTRPSAEERIEIIDLSSLVGDITTFHNTTTLTNTKNHNDGTHISSQKNEVSDEERHHKKIEVIDARTLKQKIYEDACNTAMKQADQIEKKAHVYFLNSKDHTDKKQKKLEIEQSYIPDDFDERSKELKEKQDKDEEEKRQQDEKILKQLEHEHEKLEKLETKKTILAEKKQELKEKDKKISKKDTHLEKTARELKKEAKEQKRLQRLEIRQARIEERRCKKEEKQALKLKQKQQHLRHKGKEKQKKHTPALDLDEDIKKVLLMTDSLLAELPEDVLNQFVQSEEFELYEKVLNKYKIK